MANVICGDSELIRCDLTLSAICLSSLLPRILQRSLSGLGHADVFQLVVQDFLMS